MAETSKEPMKLLELSEICNLAPNVFICYILSMATHNWCTTSSW